MDCQEWKDKDLNEAYKQFEKNLDKVKKIAKKRYRLTLFLFI